MIRSVGERETERERGLRVKLAGLVRFFEWSGAETKRVLRGSAMRRWQTGHASCSSQQPAASSQQHTLSHHRHNRFIKLAKLGSGLCIHHFSDFISLSLSFRHYHTPETRQREAVCSPVLFVRSSAHFSLASHLDLRKAQLNNTSQLAFHSIRSCNNLLSACQYIRTQRFFPDSRLERKSSCLFSP